MANKKANGKYVCSYCGKEFSQYQEADACRDNHDLVYVQISRSDLNRLIMFLQLKNEELLTESLVKTLYKYKRLKREE